MPCSRAACEVSPTLAIWGEVNTALGTKRWSLLDEVVGVQQVVLHDPRLVVGDVLELVGVRDVAQGPDVRHGGALVLVDHDDAVLDPDRGVLQRRAGRRWRRGRSRSAARRSRASVPSERETASSRRRGRPWSAVVPRRTSHWREATRVKAAETSSSSASSRRGPRCDLGDLGAERGEDVGELGGDEAAADDGHPVGAARPAASPCRWCGSRPRPAPARRRPARGCPRRSRSGRR